MLTGGAVFLGLNLILSNGLRTRNRPIQTPLAEAPGLSVSLVGPPLALPRLGIIGTAFVPALGYMTTFAALRRFTRRLAFAGSAHCFQLVATP